MTASLFIDGIWTAGSGTRRGTVFDPATGAATGEVAFAEKVDLDASLAAAQKGFEHWRAVSPFERSKVLRRAAELLRSRADEVGAVITREQGKPFGEARLEAQLAADHIEWNAEEGRRAYGRLIPARAVSVTQAVVMEPVGPVAAFSPWNFPVSQLVKKIAGSLAAGCSIIAKAPEETPSSAIILVKCFEEAGVPAGVINLVFGVPAEISEYLIPSRVIRKMSFTGSVPVGRHLGALAAQHLKRATLELGGHAPLIVCDDVDVALAAKTSLAMKFRNAGQVCVSPTRFLVQEGVYDRFVDAFTEGTAALKVGPGMAEGTQMGPLANGRRVDAIEGFVRDAVEHGATVRTGGERIGNQGYFFQPTVLTDVPLSARIQNEEPFGPVAVVSRFGDLDQAVKEANRLDFGLAAYAFTTRADRVNRLSREVESGMMSINHAGLAMPETPFGGIKDSGQGSEGGIEGLMAYLQPKFVSVKAN
jgi:succinate-semialdehyde dehydrogenase/glutarate-semialdehyde dehydrogenase